MQNKVAIKTRLALLHNFANLENVWLEGSSSFLPAAAPHTPQSVILNAVYEENLASYKFSTDKGNYLSGLLSYVFFFNGRMKLSEGQLLKCCKADS